MSEQNVHLLETRVEIALSMAIVEKVEQIMEKEVEAITITVVLRRTN